MKSSLFASAAAITWFAAACAARTPTSISSLHDAASASDSNWFHGCFQAVDGTKFSFDFQKQTVTDGADLTAVPAWLNLQSIGVGEGDDARVVILTDEYLLRGGTGLSQPVVNETTQQIDLRWDHSNNRFTAQVPNGLPIMLGTDEDNPSGYYYQFAVVVHGNWLKDPISGSSNFKFDPTTAQGSPCN